MLNKVSIFFIFLLLIPFKSVSQKIILSEEKRVVVPDSIFLGDISHLDINENKILITDGTNQQVVLFDGEEWKILNPEECHPGFKFFPIQAQFGSGDDIFISNSGVWGFRFKKNGECLKTAHKDFIASKRFYYGNKIYSLGTDFENTVVKVWNSNGSFTGEKFTVKNRFPNFEYRYEGGGITNVGENIFFIKSSEPILYTVDRKTKSLKSSRLKLFSYQKINSDIPRDYQSSEFFKEFGRVMNSSSIIQSLFKLNSKQVVVSYYRKKDEKSEIYSAVINLSELEVEHYIKTDKQPDFIGNNRFVFIERKEVDDQNEIIEIIFNKVVKS